MGFYSRPWKGRTNWDTDFLLSVFILFCTLDWKWMWKCWISDQRQLELAVPWNLKHLWFSSGVSNLEISLMEHQILNCAAIQLWSPGMLGKVAGFDGMAAGITRVFQKHRRVEHRRSFPGFFSFLSQGGRIRMALENFTFSFTNWMGNHGILEFWNGLGSEEP